MIQFYDALRAIYTKSKLDVDDIDIGTNIGLMTQLYKDMDNCFVIKNLSQYLFLIEPQYYWYLLWFSIPRKYKTPYFSKIVKNETQENKLFKKIQTFLKWSDRELALNASTLDKVLQDKLYWGKEFGLC